MTDFAHLLTETPFGIILAAILGLLWGSFFNVLIHRLPLDQTIMGFSKCPHCGADIRWFHNIPVLSFIWLRAKCAKCAKRISAQYLLVEVVTGAMFAGMFWYYGLTWQFLVYTVFVSMLFVISVIDFHHQIIPDELSLSGIVLGFLAALLTGDIVWWHSLLGLFLGGGVFFSVALLYEKIAKREGLGGGDVKLLGMIGAWLGFECLFPVIIISSALGSLVGVFMMATQRKNFKTAIPFGPFLAIAAVIYLFFGEAILDFIFPTF